MAEPARILVVDDEPAVQHALSRALTLERYEVAVAGGGSVEAERPPGGGTLMRLRLPGAAPVEPLSVLDTALHTTS